jgi:hypothetical protein
MSLTNINQQIDLCILKYINITNMRDFNVENVSQLVYNILNKDEDNEFTLEVVTTRIKTIKKYRDELKNLLKLPLMKQRTDEWFEARKTRLTASDLYDAIKGGNVSIKLAKKKANIGINRGDKAASLVCLLAVVATLSR